jgi:anti-sigma-K factor RskA
MQDRAHDDIIDLIPAYALGALDAGEVATVVEHLKSCAACQTELVAYEAVVDALPHAVPGAAPAPALKRRLMERVRQSTDADVAPAISWWQPIASALNSLRTGSRWKPALAIAAVAVLIGIFSVWQQVEPATIEPVELTATDIAPDARGVIEMAENRREATLTVAGLPALPPDQQYQLWLVADGQRASGAIFSVNAAGWAKVTVDAQRPLAEYGAFGITIEPAGGSPGPTGERVLGHSS